MTEQTTQTATSLSGDYDLDPAHSRIGFSAKHAMVTTVRGTFKSFTGEVHLDEDNVANSSAKIDIDAASLDTGNDGRDAHVRNEDFLDVEKFPKITFVSTSAEKKSDDEFVLHGDLTVKDVTKSVSIDFEKTGAADDPWGKFRVGFEGKGKINRSDWGVTFNMPLGGGFVISERVNLEFDIAAVKRDA
jgi:polyisoprenoid-binding protein YceI